MSASPRHSCPAFAELVAWLDGALDGADEDRIEAHLDACASCRARLLEWRDRLGARDAAEEPTPECPDDERLIAYAEGSAALGASAEADVERHLRQCGRCASVLQRIMAAPLPEAPVEAVRPVEVERAPAAPARRIGAWLGALREWLTLPPLQWAVAAAAVLVLAVGVSRFAMPGTPLDQMRDSAPAANAEVVADVVAHARPDAAEPVVARLRSGTRGAWLEASGSWTRLELADGRRVWVPSASVRRLQP
ncbi:zf-HC2 domain-containing protein [bacterium]|nr:zf-HC2 domain-containing protein [bacterium]